MRTPQARRAVAWKVLERHTVGTRKIDHGSEQRRRNALGLLRPVTLLNHPRHVRIVGLNDKHCRRVLIGDKLNAQRHRSDFSGKDIAVDGGKASIAFADDAPVPCRARRRDTAPAAAGSVDAYDHPVRHCKG